jgi:hypothetical protein
MHAVGAGGGEHRLCVGRTHRQRLFAQHVLAGGAGLDRPFGMQVIRQRDIHRLDVRVGQQRLVGAEMPGDAEFRRERRGLGGIAAGHRRHHGERGPGEPAGKLPRDVGRPEHAIPNRRKSAHRPFSQNRRAALMAAMSKHFHPSPSAAAPSRAAR